MSPSTKKKSAGAAGAGKSSATGVSKADRQSPVEAVMRTSRGARLRDCTAITKALGDETRVRVLLMLQRGELCVCQIVEFAGLATSTISKHMSILKLAGLVESRKEGRWMYYRLADDSAPVVVQQAIAWVSQSLAKDPQVQLDRQRIAAICNSDPHELCLGQYSRENGQDRRENN